MTVQASDTYTGIIIIIIIIHSQATSMAIATFRNAVM
jgi:hypothetical protein